MSAKRTRRVIFNYDSSDDELDWIETAFFVLQKIQKGEQPNEDELSTAKCGLKTTVKFMKLYRDKAIKDGTAIPTKEDKHANQEN